MACVDYRTADSWRTTLLDTVWTGDRRRGRLVWVRIFANRGRTAAGRQRAGQRVIGRQLRTLSVPVSAQC